MNPKIVGWALLGGLLLAGCQGQKQADEAGSPEGASSAGEVEQRDDPRAQLRGMEGLQDELDRANVHQRDTTPVNTKVIGVKLSNQGDTEANTIGAPMSSFGPRDTVYAEVESQGTASEYTVYAKWVGADGAELADYGIRVNEAGLKRTVISLNKPDGWLPGDSRIELAINGNPTVVQEFRVTQ